MDFKLIESWRRVAECAMALGLALFSHAQAEVIDADVCIYGGTSGGVAAAVQASRMGKKVVIAEPGRHLGGMTSGGLSAVDIGDPRTVGGISREYFTRLVASYGKKLEWDRPFESKGGGPATGGAHSIEPHVAEQIFDTMAREANVKVHWVVREGKTAGGRGGFGPYQIGYGAIVPKAAECENLLVTFALSASHTAFSSIRMEPVFMVISQSAATAACVAIDSGTMVQNVDYGKLRERLVGDGQVLSPKSAP